MGEECSFPFIPFLDSEVVVPPADVYDCKLGASTEVVDDLGNEGGYVPILLHPFVYGLIVLYWSEFSILLLHKEEIGCIRGFGYVDCSPFEMFLYKFVHLTLFFLGEWE